jgi:flagellar biosynthesis regulator FlaF
MIITNKFGEKLDISYLGLEESDLMSMKLTEVQELKNKIKVIDVDFADEETTSKIDALKFQFFELIKKADRQIAAYQEFCYKAQVRLIVECNGMVTEAEIRQKTDNYPGMDILYKSACKLQSPDYIFALMQQTVLKHREINRGLADAIKRSDSKEFSYEELLRLDKGAAALALQRGFMQVSDVLAGKAKPDSYNEEFCVMQKTPEELRAVFISVGVRNNLKPNINVVKRIMNDPKVYFNDVSEARLEAEVKVNLNCGSVDGQPTPIIAKVPYFLRSYEVKIQKVIKPKPVL